MMKRVFWLLFAWLLAALAGCGGQAKSVPKEGVVYMDPNAAPTAAVVAASEPAQGPASPAPSVDQVQEAVDGTAEAPSDLYFEYRGVRIEPMMEAAPVLLALGDPLRSFEADSCAYVGKDVFYAYPGVELTVNQVEGAERITSIHLTDDTVTIPQGLRIYDEEEKLLSILGGKDDDGIYTYESGQTLLLIQMNTAESGIRRIWSMEYRAANGQ